MTAVIVIGGHRSGTSLTAHLLHELGFPAAPLPERLLQPKAGRESDNPDGYWEDIAFVRLHRRMLGETNRSLGGWMNPRRDDAEVARLLPKYRTLLRERSAYSADWSLKDPRLCLLTDVLFDELERQGIDVRVVATSRPIADVARSLQKRGLNHRTATEVAERFDLAAAAAVQLAQERCLPVLRLSLLTASDTRQLHNQIQSLAEFVSREPAESLFEIPRPGGSFPTV